jgi:hypothetical protein
MEEHMSISETTLTRIIDAGERADDVVRHIGRRARAMNESDAAPIARALGWFSVGLGVAEVLAPASMARMTGMQGYETALRLFGLREIASGIGILAGPGPAASWLWARVAGDALDLGLIGVAAGSNDGEGGKRALAAGAVAGVMLADILCAQRLAADSR